MFNIVNFLPIISKSYYGNIDVTKSFLDIPLGSGPYKISEVDPGRRIIYSRIKDYWAKNLPVNKGQYNFDTLIYNYYKDSNVQLEAFKVGEYDYRREWNVKRWVTGYDFNAVKNGNVILTEMKNDRPTGMDGLVMNTRKKIFQSRRVREALNYAYDFEWYNKVLGYNAYTRTNSYFENSPLASKGLPSKKEIELLNQWKDLLPNEVFSKAYKAPINEDASSLRENLKIAKKILFGIHAQV